MGRALRADRGDSRRSGPGRANTARGQPSGGEAPVGRGQRHRCARAGAGCGAAPGGDFRRGRGGPAERLAEAYPAETAEFRRLGFSPAVDEVIGGIGPQLRLLTFAAVLVLLIASVNIANLSLARASARSRELAVRTALGAGRGALLRLLATESAMLGAAGAGLGLLGAYWCVTLTRAAGQEVLPRAAEIALDWRLVLGAALVAVLLVVLLGLLPV